MAAGEHVSVRSQREMFKYQIGLERNEPAAYPELISNECQPNRLGPVA
jgi:vacuolar iron transporter family protein